MCIRDSWSSLAHSRPGMMWRNSRSKAYPALFNFAPFEGLFFVCTTKGRATAYPALPLSVVRRKSGSAYPAFPCRPNNGQARTVEPARRQPERVAGFRVAIYRVWSKTSKTELPLTWCGVVFRRCIFSRRRPAAACFAFNLGVISQCRFFLLPRIKLPQHQG